MSFLKRISIVVLCNFFLFSNCSFANSIEFNKEQLERIIAQYKGQQWLMLLWSVDCPPCFKELVIIQKLQHQFDGLNVVIINSDADDEIEEERNEIINKFGLNNLANFHFADGKSDQSRFLIDPQWYGELPRSYFVEKTGKFHGKSGLVNESLLTHWLVPRN